MKMMKGVDFLFIHSRKRVQDAKKVENDLLLGEAHGNFPGVARRQTGRYEISLGTGKPLRYLYSIYTATRYIC